VKDLVLCQLKQRVIGENPLNVDRLYTKMLMLSAGAGAPAGVTLPAASGIEIALEAVNRLGGPFPDRVRFYRTMPAEERPAEPQGPARPGAGGTR
jgi:L-alanine-DL-glutamate epimerase-like enolase superfamily enzyme